MLQTRTMQTRTTYQSPVLADPNMRPTQFNVDFRALLLALLVLSPAAATAQQPEAIPAGPQQAQPAPGAFEVATHWRQVADSAAQAERTIARVGRVSPLAAEVAEAARRQGELQALLEALGDADYVRPERLSRMRDQALLEDQRLEALRTRVFDRLAQLGAIRSEWMERQRTWRGWRQDLRADPDFPAVQPDLDRAIARMDTVVRQAVAPMAELLDLQRRLDDLRAEIEERQVLLTAVRVGRRAALVERGEPVLFSGAHRSQLAEQRLAGWEPLAHLHPGVLLTFVRDHAGLLLFHLILAVGVALVARRLRRRVRTLEAWSGGLDHPWALGIFTSVVVALQRVMLAPPFWDVVLWALLGGTAMILARPLFTTYALRLTVYIFAVFYPAFLLLEVTRLPTPVFRVVLAIIAAVALPAFVLMARRRSRAVPAPEASDPRRYWPLRIGAAMWAAVLVGVVVGFDALARWILHATITSAAVVFVLVVVLAAVRGGLASRLEEEVADRPPGMRRIGILLMQRLMVVVQAVVIAGVVLILLDVWQLAESPVATWQRIAGWGIEAGQLQLTVARLLTAALLIYLAVLASWLIRSFVESEAYRRWELDQNVGQSISRLLHYTLITLGLLFALGALGIQLQNFAILAGALGIGVGFGLQNVVNNFASGLILLFERPVRVGDTVVVGEIWGTIQKIGLRSTVMVTFDQAEMILPNSDLVSEKVTNWTLSDTNSRLILSIGVAYGSPIEEVLQILRESGTAHESALDEPPPQALFAGFGDSSLDFELRIWVSAIRRRFEVRSAVLTEVERRLREAGIEIPFPQRDLHLRSVDGEAVKAITAD